MSFLPPFTTEPVLALPLATAGAACALLALRRGQRACAAWLGLLLLASAALCSLLRAGPAVTYTHLRPDLSEPAARAALAILAVQAALVAAALWLQRRRWAPQLGRALGARGALALVALLALTAAKIARPPRAFAFELAAATAVHLVALGNLGLALGALSPERAKALHGAWRRLLSGADRAPDDARERTTEVPEPGGMDAFAWVAAAAAALASALLCVFVYQRHPHVPDEVVYLMHARYLAAGKLWLAAPPVAEAFDVDLMLLSGSRWYCPVPIGWPIVLALGAACGVPWLVNPLLSGAGVALVYLFVREIAPRATARAAAFLLATSPWLLFLGMSFMTHALALCCAVLAALGVARARRTRSVGWGWVSGAAVGMASLIRPLDGLVLALLLGLWSIGLGGARLRAGAIAGLVLGAVLVGGATLPYNRLMTGSATRFPIMEHGDVAYGKGSNDLGFGPDKGMGWSGLDPWPGHTPLQSLVNDQFNLFALDSDTFGWSTGSLWPLWLALLWTARARRTRWMLCAAGAVIFASSFYYFAGGPDFGARYWYTLFVPCALLVLWGLEALAQRVSTRAELCLPALALVALSTHLPWRAHDKYPGYRGMRAELAQLAQSRDFGCSLVLVRGERHPDYASAAVLNPLDWRADAPIYAWDKSDEVRLEVLRAYADRTVWIVDGPSVTKAGYRVVSGPLSASEMIERTREDLSR